MTLFVVRGNCEHEGNCDAPNEEPLIVLMFAESDSDQKKMIELIDDSKPILSQPGMSIMVESGVETASIGEAILQILQRFLIWKKIQSEERKAKGTSPTIVPPQGEPVAAVAAEEDPFTNMTEFDTDKEFGSGG